MLGKGKNDFFMPSHCWERAKKLYLCRPSVGKGLKSFFYAVPVFGKDEKLIKYPFPKEKPPKSG
jgi:hypothetical protein